MTGEVEIFPISWEELPPGITKMQEFCSRGGYGDDADSFIPVIVAVNLQDHSHYQHLHTRFRKFVGKFPLSIFLGKL